MGPRSSTAVALGALLMVSVWGGDVAATVDAVDALTKEVGNSVVPRNNNSLNEMERRLASTMPTAVAVLKLQRSRITCATGCSIGRRTNCLEDTFGRGL